MKTLLLSLFCFASLSVLAAQQAVTDEGQVVILNDDGTWLYAQGNEPEELVIPVNDNVFTTHKDSSFPLKSSKTNSVFAINPKKWRFTKNKGAHEAAEYTFQLKSNDLYGMAISEEIEIGMEQLADIALENAKTVAADTRVVNKEYRVVNGKKLIYMEMIGTIQGVKFKYLGYYYSDESGSTQFLAYTGVNLVAKYQTEIDKFLNGFAVR